MNNPPLVTIIVSVYNKLDTVGQCISSLLAVDYPNYEIQVVEGYSTDGSYEVLKRFEDNIHILRLRGNYAEALNRALREVRSPLVALTDADCTVDKNWLRELVHGFDEEDDVVAVAGYVGTGKGLSLLPTLIGIECQERYRYFPKYLSRSSTMNLCIRTEVVRRVGFDESLSVAIETDFGYRLTKLGKMLYVPRAIASHYPRTTWKDFFLQQVNFARGASRVYLQHKDKLRGDHITTFSMIWQIPLFCIACLLLCSGIFSQTLLNISLCLFLILFVVYLRDMVRLPIRKRYYPVMWALFLVRTLGWTVGAIDGFSRQLIRREYSKMGKPSSRMTGT